MSTRAIVTLPLHAICRTPPTTASPLTEHAVGARKLAGFWGYSEGTLSRGAAETKVGGCDVTGNYFEVMGLSPILGRLTLPSDDGTGVPPVMVLSR